MRAQDRQRGSGRDRAAAAPAARTTTSPAPETARRAAVTGETGHFPPEAAAALQRTAGNTAFSATLTAQERHRHGAGRGHTEPPVVQRSPVQDVLRTPGRPLDGSVRADMESRLGADFSDVRVHTDAAAHDSAEAVNARAYTSGSHIVFQRGRYDGSSAAGRHVLAQELTHVRANFGRIVTDYAGLEGLPAVDPGMQDLVRAFPLHASASDRLRAKVKARPNDRLHYQAVNPEHMADDDPASRRVEFRDIQAQRGLEDLLSDLRYLTSLLQGVRDEVSVEQTNRLQDRHRT
ncbi:DUF4157 domain-containing protein [Streptomyces sp. NPDC053427]|uniref:DUF4157 domain-containing protein n=1 Tax=Streptomyces sp. NPDC053427 TaxID=3365701 RepID=UPI0037D21A08